jgi:hypothetical protein
MEENKMPSYAPIIVKLFQTVIYDDDRKTWQELLSFQHQIRNYFATIGVQLHLNDQDGFAFLSQPDEYEGEKVPRLVRRMPLSYEVTLLLVVLREAIEEFDVQNTDNRKLFITNEDLKERIELFFEDKADKVKLLSRFDTYINSVESLGFIKQADVRTFDESIKTYEVKRIIKAKINNEKLEEIKAKMSGKIN